MADPDYKQMLVNSNADDVLLTRAFTGLQTNMLRPSVVAAGLDPDHLPERGVIDVSKDLTADQPRRWRDIWSAGHSVSSVTGIASVEALIESVTAEYQSAQSSGGQDRQRRDHNGPKSDGRISASRTPGLWTTDASHGGRAK